VVSQVERAGDGSPSELEQHGAPAAAVLAPLHEVDGEPHVILTRRSQHLRAHRGEVSFPGGRQELGEDLWRTALRESHEEIGLDPSSVTRVGELDHLSTVTSRAFIVPYVGVVDPLGDLVANPSEVELIRHVPLRELLSDGVYREERWGIAGLERPVHFFEIDGDTVWGATASMLRNLLAIATGTAEVAGAGW
jgi:8-oxo-dGTP pyrophosphatase MutT (NUDIX family)